MNKFVVAVLCALWAFTSAAAVPQIQGQGLLWIGDFGRGIYTVDPSSGAATKRLDVNVGSSVINDLAFDTRSGLLYGISGGALFGTPNTLFTIDLKSPSLTLKLLGTVKPPDASASAIDGLAFVDGALIGVEWNGQANAVFTIDTHTLAVSNTHYLHSPMNYNINDLASSGSAAAPFGLQGLPVNLFTFAPGSGAVSVIGHPGTTDFQYGLAYAADRNKFYTAGSDRTVWEIDPVTLATRSIGTPSGSGGIAGLEYVPITVVPEPATAALLALGLAGLLGARLARRD